MKKLTILLTILLTVNLPILIYLANFKLMIYDRDYYLSEFKKNRVYDKVADANNRLDEVLFLFKTNSPLSNAFNENEKSHMVDVRNLIVWLNYSFYASLALEILLIAALFLTHRKDIPLFIDMTGLIFIITGLSMLLASLIMYIFSGSFSDMFVTFHQIFFPWGNWQFPDSSILIQMFPEEFFYNFTYKVVSNALITAIITTVLGIILVVPNKKIKNR